jgi:hypothetical protein
MKYIENIIRVKKEMKSPIYGNGEYVGEGTKTESFFFTSDNNAYKYAYENDNSSDILTEYLFLDENLDDENMNIRSHIESEEILLEDVDTGDVEITVNVERVTIDEYWSDFTNDIINIEDEFFYMRSMKCEILGVVSYKKVLVEKVLEVA